MLLKILWSFKTKSWSFNEARYSLNELVTSQRVGRFVPGSCGIGQGGGDPFYWNQGWSQIILKWRYLNNMWAREEVIQGMGLNIMKS